MKTTKLPYLEFEPQAEQIADIGDRQKIVSINRLSFNKAIRKALNFKYNSGYFYFFDVSKQLPPLHCKIPECYQSAQILETIPQNK